MKNIIAGTSSMVGPSGPKPKGDVVYPAFAAAALVAWEAPLTPNTFWPSRLNELMKVACQLASNSTTTTAKPIMPPRKHHFWILAYPDIPSETSRPASAIVMSVTMKIPLLVPNHAAPPPGQVHFSVAQSGSNNWTDRMLP